MILNQAIGHLRKKAGVIAMLIIGLSIAAPTQVANGAEYVVKIKAQAHFTTLSESLARITGVTVLDSHKTGNLISIETGDTKNLKALSQMEEIRALDGVEYVVPNIKFHTFGTPNDPKFGEQWSLAKVNAALAWDTNTGSKNIVVAVIDTGIDWKHEDLAQSIWTNTDEIAGNNIDDDGNGFVDDVRGWDFRDNDADPMDETGRQNPGHGTHCAGIIGGIGDNGKGISGMSQSVSLMPVRFLGADGSGDLLNGAKAIDYAVQNGADVISASWGAAIAESQVKPILEAIERANAAGVIFVAAAANDGKNNDTRSIFPANAKSANVISVAASNPQDGKPSWSNFGRATVHLASPGADILSTLPDGRYSNLSGTSMATPLVAGLVGILKAQAIREGKTLNGEQARSILQTTGAKVAIETACDCRVDANAAVNFVRDNEITVTPASATIAPGTSKTFTGFGGTAPYKFTSSNTSAATITEDGALTAVADGTTVLAMTDANGTTVNSMNIYVGAVDSGGGGGGEACPIADPTTCMIMCLFDPTLPWCQDLPIPSPFKK